MAVVVGRLCNSIRNSGQQHPAKNLAIFAAIGESSVKNPFGEHDLGFFLKFFQFHSSDRISCDAACVDYNGFVRDSRDPKGSASPNSCINDDSHPMN
jgi:hypothetical protein